MSDARSKHVFISIGSRYTSDQEAFLQRLQDMLMDFGVTPHVMNLTDYPSGNPLKGILQVMRKCHGAIIVAFERKHFETGIECRGSPPPREKRLKGVRLPTPFNHIEAAIAATLGISVLVLCEPGIYRRTP